MKSSVRKGILLMPLLLMAIFLACFSGRAIGREPVIVGEAQAVSRSKAPVPAQGFVYTANERDNSISRLDLSTWRVEHVAIPITPHNVQVSGEGMKLLVVGEAAESHQHQSANNQARHDEADDEQEHGRLLILDTTSLTAEGALNVEIGNHPAHVISDATGAHAYVTNSNDDTVHVIDLKRKKIIREIKTGDYPHGLRMSPNGREIYVANVNDNSVSVIDLSQQKEVARIPVGKAPVQVGFTPDGGRAYVSLRDENKVAILDTVKRQVIGAVDVGRNPIQLFVTPDGRHVYVANEGTKEEPDETASVTDTATNKVISTIKTGKGAHGVAMSADGRHAFVSNSVDDTVSVIDTAELQVIRTVAVGKGPSGITFGQTSR